MPLFTKHCNMLISVSKLSVRRLQTILLHKEKPKSLSAADIRVHMGHDFWFAKVEIFLN